MSFPCDVSFRHCPETEWEIGPARIRAASVAHRGPTLGYRIDDGDSSLTYIPDHEPALGADFDRFRGGWISGFALARDTSLLIHDGQYADAEYPEHVGWGPRRSPRLSFAHRTSAERTVLFHHDPMHPTSGSTCSAAKPRRAGRARRREGRSSSASSGRVRAAGGAKRRQRFPRLKAAPATAGLACRRPLGSSGSPIGARLVRRSRWRRRTRRAVAQRQRRRPYIDHPVAVAELLSSTVSGDDLLAAALLTTWSRTAIQAWRSPTFRRCGGGPGSR